MTMSNSIVSNLSDYVLDIVSRSKQASLCLRTLETNFKNDILREVASLLNSSRAIIKEANQLDLLYAKENNLSPSMLDRLIISDKTIDGMIKSVLDIVQLKDPVGEIISGWKTEKGLNISKHRIPIGVLLIIYESRPNITIEIAALCLKSSNAVILRSGKEAIHSATCLNNLFQQALKNKNVNIDSVQLIQKLDRSLIIDFVKQKDYIDLVIPRGGEQLINFVSEHSLIPIVKHDKGVCHTYVHHSAQKKDAIQIILNAKTQRTGVCNSLESLLLDKQCTFIDEILLALQEAGVVLHGDSETKKELANFNIQDLYEATYSTEYLSMDISIKLVNNIDDAIQHIKKYGSSHSEAILAEDYSIINKFLNSIDSAALFVNASTRFHDGGEFGLGAEMGIATGKLHTRGPMGLSDLTTYQYIVHGNGHIRN